MNKTYALPYSEMRGNIQNEAVLYRWFDNEKIILL